MWHTVMHSIWPSPWYIFKTNWSNKHDLAKSLKCSDLDIYFWMYHFCPSMTEVWPYPLPFFLANQFYWTKLYDIHWCRLVICDDICNEKVLQPQICEMSFMHCDWHRKHIKLVWSSGQSISIFFVKQAYFDPYLWTIIYFII